MAKHDVEDRLVRAGGDIKTHMQAIGTRKQIAESCTACADRITKTRIAWLTIPTKTKEIQIDIGVGDGSRCAQPAVKPDASGAVASLSFADQ